MCPSDSDKCILACYHWDRSASRRIPTTRSGHPLCLSNFHLKTPLLRVFPFQTLEERKRGKDHFWNETLNRNEWLHVSMKRLFKIWLVVTQILMVIGYDLALQRICFYRVVSRSLIRVTGTNCSRFLIGKLLKGKLLEGKENRSERDRYLFNYFWFYIVFSFRKCISGFL